MVLLLADKYCKAIEVKETFCPAVICIQQKQQVNLLQRSHHRSKENSICQRGSHIPGVAVLSVAAFT